MTQLATSNRNEVKDRLLGWAKEVHNADKEMALSLQGLGAAVADGIAADGWANAGSLETIIDVDYVSGLHHKVRKLAHEERQADLIRNLVVFAPLLITWLGIFFAVLGNQSLLQRGLVRPGDSFFSLWQEGFRGSSFSLDTVALLDVCAILLIIWLTYRAHRVGSRLDEAHQVAVADLKRVLTMAAIHLGQVSSNQPIAVSSILQKAAGELVNELKVERIRLTELADKREKEFGDLSVFAPQLKTGAEAIKSAADGLAGTQTKYLEAFSKLETQLRTAGEQQKTLVSGTTSAADSMKVLASRTELVVSQIKDLLTPIQQLQAKLSESVTSASSVSNQIAGGQNRLVTAIADERAAHERVAQALNLTGASLGNALTQIHHAAAELAQITHDLQRISGHLATLPATLGHDTTNMAQSQATIAANVKAAGELMQASVFSLVEAARTISAAGKAPGQSS